MKFIVKNIFRFDEKIKGFTENHLLLLIYLQEFTTCRNKIYFTFSFMFENLGITYHKLKQELCKCLFDLYNWELISIINNNIKNINQNTNIVIEKIEYNSNYTLLSAKEIDKILYSNLDIRLIKTMLYVYVIICSWIGASGRQYCFPKLEDFKKDIGTTSNKRIVNAIQKLKELGLIDYKNIGVVKGDGKIYQSNNVYVLTATKNYQKILRHASEESKNYYETIM